MGNPATRTPTLAAVSRTVIALAIGLVAGVVSGLFGVGGGVIVVPGLILSLGFPQRRASGTSMATIVLSSAAALLVFSGGGEVDWRAAALVFSGSAVGAWIGARYLGRVPERWLGIGFSVVMFAAAARMLLG